MRIEHHKNGRHRIIVDDHEMRLIANGLKEMGDCFIYDNASDRLKSKSMAAGIKRYLRRNKYV